MRIILQMQHYLQARQATYDPLKERHNTAPPVEMANNFTTGGKHTENQNHQNQHQSRPGEIRRTPSAEQAPSSYLQGNLDPRGFSGPSLSPVPENRQSRAPSRLQISTTPTPSNPQSGQPRGNTMTQGSSSHHDRRRESGESESRNPRQEPPAEAPLPKRRRSSAHRRDPSHTHSPGSAYPPEPEHTTCHPRRSDKSSASADRDYFPHTYTSKISSMLRPGIAIVFVSGLLILNAFLFCLLGALFSGSSAPYAFLISKSQATSIEATPVSTL
ncbi:uncharacterized protein PHACADRAFT_197237 [Phanerochaete carnosa HHB-10118-sp]|uniref:Uncharacterized protein n=1 Tax=Phanerochaete carnosa (strain HHB-10118-sp) TaxID=650164 RepID=K5WWJ5_PHACS|nr:uncharacterized protein PHACADRAFT_197237 [Phanerochaete carnosa HHB-10118-sp]EKM54807.1 hypothetical protein PHACADRAFT_197237 [Phanerochaete carnosa HHB-10118-sp]